MKIKDIHVYRLRHHLSEPFGFSQWWYNTREMLLVEIETDEGLSGWGEAYGPAPVTGAAVKHYFKPLLIGREALEASTLWEFMYRRSIDYGRKGVMIAALSAIDIALWDIRGQVENKPVYKLLSGSDRDILQLPAYATGMYFKKREDLPNFLAGEAAGYVAQGFKGIKMKIGLSREEDMANVEAVKTKIGEDVFLMVDANHAYEPQEAIAMGRQMEKYSLSWFEEPVSPDDYDGYRQVKNETRILIAGGECEFTRYGFEPLLKNNCVDIVQPDPCSAGGITEMIKIRGLAEKCGIPIFFHTWGSAIAVAVSLHLSAGLFGSEKLENISLPWPWIELDRTENPFREELLLNPIELKEGNLSVPQGPGLGINPDRDMMDKHRVDI